MARRSVCRREAWIAIDLLSLEEREEHLGLVDLTRRNLEQIVVENDHVSGLADFDRTGLPLLKVHVCRRDGIAGENGGQVDNLLRDPRGTGAGFRVAPRNGN